MAVVRARCNRRECQARRNLSKPLEQYKTRPKCHIPGCGGLMYVDKYRQRKGPKDHPPVCYDNCYPFLHRVDSPNCKQREQYVTSKLFKPKSKHCPHKVLDEVPF